MRIDELMKEKGYTITSLAVKMGTSKQNLFAKLKSPSYPTLVEISNALDVPMWQLFASPKDVAPTQPTQPICPHCGKPINIEIK